MRVNFNERYQPEKQLQFMEDALLSTGLASDGKYASLSREFLSKSLGIRHLLFTTSATAALELALSLLSLEPGDEVILPSYNFPSAANAVLRFGGCPVLCDIEGETKNISLEDAAARITKKTKAIITTHYAGISCDMDQLLRLGRDHRLIIIEDAAQALFSYYKQIPLGTIGDFGAYSFHHTKNYSCGEGGAFLSKSSCYMEAAEQFRDNGTNKAQFLRKETEFYSWQQPGSNYVLSEACTALLYPQLLEHQEILSRRKLISDTYFQCFSQGKETVKEKLFPMVIPAYAHPNYHVFYINCANHQIRENLRAYLLTEGIDVRTHFVPLHLSSYGVKSGYTANQFPSSVAAADCILRLPIHTEMTKGQAEQIGELIMEWGKGI